MKTLQNNFTTIEQSKRLLVLGVPADSADCFYSSDNQGEEEFPNIIPIVNDGIICFSLFCNNKAVPCWSVGRLIEIELMCREKMDGLLPRLAFVYGNVSYIEELIRYMERKDHKYNFNKLED